MTLTTHYTGSVKKVLCVTLDENHYMQLFDAAAIALASFKPNRLKA
jgi:hypothetical protein